MAQQHRPGPWWARAGWARSCRICCIWPAFSASSSRIAAGPPGEARVRAGPDGAQGRAHADGRTGVGERLSARRWCTTASYSALFQRARGGTWTSSAKLIGKQVFHIYDQKEVVTDPDRQAPGRRRARFCSRSEISVPRFWREPSRTIRFRHQGRPMRSNAISSAAATASMAYAGPSFPSGVRKGYDRDLSVRLARHIVGDFAAPDHELIYAPRARLYAAFSMRGPRSVAPLSPGAARRRRRAVVLTRASGDELGERGSPGCGSSCAPGILQKGVTPMLYSFVTEPMRQSCLFLAGDAAHLSCSADRRQRQ